jgi:hypothetical protein
VRLPVYHHGTPSPAPTWKQRINPIWLMDDVFRPAGYNYWAWLWRQKLPQNFCAFVIGVQDLGHSFEGSKTSDGIFADGWQFGLVNGVLPLISYRGARVECYIGWRPIGAFGYAFRVSHANPWNKTDAPH